MKHQITRYTCDAPLCGIERDEVGGALKGLRGKVSEDSGDAGGVSNVEWFACCREHVGSAIASAVDFAWRQS